RSGTGGGYSAGGRTTPVTGGCGCPHPQFSKGPAVASLSWLGPRRPEFGRPVTTRVSSTLLVALCCVRLVVEGGKSPSYIDRGATTGLCPRESWRPTSRPKTAPCGKWKRRRASGAGSVDSSATPSTGTGGAGP